MAAASTASTDAAADVYGPRMTANAAIKRVTRERGSVRRETHLIPHPLRLCGPSVRSLRRKVEPEADRLGDVVGEAGAEDGLQVALVVLRETDPDEPAGLALHNACSTGFRAIVSTQRERRHVIVTMLKLLLPCG